MVIRLSRAVAVGIIAGCMLAAAAHAGTADEIQHLLDYVSGSGCTFVRNGVESDAVAARKHIQAKYASAKGHVGSAEDFIRLAASRSSMTGEPYVVRCGSSRFLSGDWLTDELGRYRNAGPCFPRGHPSRPAPGRSPQ
jgi:Family of unknown function (DUF5329)